jgi:acyl-CoA reductase-like NAD-dependent aldehyde dehydrogenase
MIELRSCAGGMEVGGGGWIERRNPARLHELVGRVECVDREGAVAAIEAAHAAFPRWRALSLEERSRLLVDAAEAVVGTTDELGPLLARELGKVVADCRGEMGFAGAYLRACVDAAPRVTASVEIDDPDGRLTIRREPYGVVAAIVPWNAPLILSILKVAPALVTGNTIVVKPSPIAPLAVTRALGAIAAGLPPGVLSVIHGGAEVGEVLVGHPLVRKVAFTGGTTTGKAVGRTAAETIKPLVLELGGNDPALFLDDAVFDDATMDRVVFGTFLTSGQVCMAAKRLYVPRHRATEFVDAYLAAADRVLRLGDPLDPEVTIGPMATDEQRSYVTALVEDARSRGGSVHQLGTVADVDLDGGWFLRPTLVTDVPDDALVVTQEQFGPTVPLLVYDDLDDAVRRANDSPMGLASSVWSTDEDRAFTVADRLETGMTFINCHNRAGMSLRAPFGGVKQSGFGREFGDAGVAEYVQTHSIHLPATARAGGPTVAPNAYPGQDPAG